MDRMTKEVFREEIPRPYSSFINELEEENKKLKSDLASERTMLDNVKEDLTSTLLLAAMMKKMKKSEIETEIETLIQELNSLSECEKQNIARMKEIAHVLVAYYTRGKQGSVKSAGKKSKRKIADKDTASDVGT